MKPVRTSRIQWLACLACSDLSAPLRSVALAVAVHMTKRGEGAFPSARRVAALTGLSFGYAGKLLRRLVAEGWLAATDRTPRKHRGRPPKAYAATVPACYSAPLTAGRKSHDFVSSMRDTNSSADAGCDFVSSKNDTKGGGYFVSSEGDFVSSMKDTDISLTEIEARSVEARQSNASVVEAEKAADYAMKGNGSAGRAGPCRGGRGRPQ